MKNRLFIGKGTSQLLFLAASLNKNKKIDRGNYRDILIFKGVNYELNLKFYKKLISSIWTWHNLLFLDPEDENDYTDQIKKISKEYSQLNEIWVCMPFNRLEEELLCLYPSAKIVQYDDGLGSYVLPNTFFEYLAKPSLLNKHLRLYFKRLFNFFKKCLKLNFDAFPELGYKKKYRLFSNFHQKFNLYKKDIIVDWIYLKEEILRFDLKVKKISKSDKKTCLVLGQYFSLYGYLDRQEELNHYLRLCKFIENQGYYIFWKEHPRNHNPFYNEIKQSIKSFENLSHSDGRDIPIELIASQLNIDLFVSVTSTSLITLNKLFNYKILSSAPLIKDKLVGADRFVAETLLINLNDKELLESME